MQQLQTNATPQLVTNNAKVHYLLKTRAASEHRTAALADPKQHTRRSPRVTAGRV